ncbi:competence type IV pilus minor pilin ComGG [Bacillus altitudinis]|uniref:competence type IV pilus minor pilin ComGG n=1 Tax=Bacillus altitudinis TaxID=293387 RepID=UPI000310F123|nr:competence type IV pilus minor pilin ComGG [Bacillus altitudinis]MEC1183940.1 competence type IV pilus minor pilin ComGG [Bacillus altitudinis]
MKREDGFIYPHVLAVILLFLLILGSMTIGFQKELKSAELTISFYQKQQLFRLGLSESANKLNRICDQPLSPIVTEEGRVTLKRIGCDDRKKIVRLLVNIETKGGVTDERELEMNKETGEINQWISTY